jgi:AraC family transcriptional regulator of adaptative response/methylated-DNA-[protein]-cysteine methyltransferase
VDARWDAVLARDATADGRFVFAVRTTGVYCRPSCGARRPHRRNVVFYGNGEAARADGFRACKRCQPDARLADSAVRAQLVAQVCRWIDAADDRRLSLAELAARAGYSPFHLQRVFVATVGLSPRAYAAARRAERVRSALPRSRTVTAAVQRAGYGSSGRFYAEATAVLGMRAARAQGGGAGERIEYAIVDCALGRALVAATPRGVCAILLGDDDAVLQRDLAARFPRAEVVCGDGGLSRHTQAVVAIVDGAAPPESVPLDVRGTAFQQRVWNELRRIPRGSTASYAAIAQRLGAPRSARAIAQACAANPLAVVVPCHRVVRSDGELSGYRWGVARKRALLAREQRDAAEG